MGHGKSMVGQGCGRAWAAGGRLVEYMKSRRPRSSSVRRLQSSTSGGRLAISGSRSKHTVADCAARWRHSGAAANLRHALSMLRACPGTPLPDRAADAAPSLFYSSRRRTAVHLSQVPSCAQFADHMAFPSLTEAHRVAHELAQLGLERAALHHRPGRAVQRHQLGLRPEQRVHLAPHAQRARRCARGRASSGSKASSGFSATRAAHAARVLPRKRGMLASRGNFARRIYAQNATLHPRSSGTCLRSMGSRAPICGMASHEERQRNA